MDVGKGHSACIVKGHSSLLAFLGGDKHHTIGSARTIDGRCRSILQHLNRLYVLRIEIVNAAILDNHPIHHIQRGVGCGNGAFATDNDAAHCSRPLTVGDVYTGCLALHAFKHVFHRHGSQLLRTYMGQSSRNVALALHTIADNHHFGQVLMVFLQNDIEAGAPANGNLLCRKTNVRNHESALFRGIGDAEVAVKVGHAAIRRALYGYACTDNRFTRTVCNLACNPVLCIGKRHTKQEDG